MALRRVIDVSKPECLADLFVRNREAHTRNTSTSDQFHPPRIRNEYGRRRFAHRAAVLYNALPADVHDYASRKAFGRALREHMLSAG